PPPGAACRPLALPYSATSSSLLLPPWGGPKRPYSTFHPSRKSGTTSVFSNWDVVEPDLLFVAATQRDIIGEKNVQGAPALVIEVLSPGTRRRDQGIKRELFERTGVREYWLVDPDKDQVHVYRRANDGAGFARGLAISTDLETPLLPGFSLSLKRLFARRR
ncbi:MAG TPA: Uma2 family endonuclease, partial [Vicinamibacterales bacterium]|nr:Uma2 family endonuclease [Vicinamibacterales bacterium]